MEGDLSVKLAQEEMSKKHMGASILITVSHIQKIHTNIRFRSNISAQEFGNVKKKWVQK